MTYNPEIHHRRSIRLREYDYSLAGAYFVTVCAWKKECLFGEIKNGEMLLNEYGEIVTKCWDDLPNHYHHAQLDEIAIMPKKYDLSKFKYLFLAGERLDPDTYHWAHDLLQKPVIDHWWQTETGWPITANCMGIEQFPIKPGSSTKPVPGYDVRILDSNGKELGAKKEGLVVIKLPLPPGTLPTLWNADERFLESYTKVFPGYYFTSDGGYRDEDGYTFIMGRVDDVINVAGHRLSTGEMEEIVAQHPDVAECAVFGIHDSLKGQLPLGLVVLKSGASREEMDIKKELVNMIREEIGPVACFKSRKASENTFRKDPEGDHAQDR